MERRKFEDTFREAFQGAETEPSDNVWTNLELDLEKEDSSRMKRRLLFFQLLAAASITFAMVMAGIGYYTLSTKGAFGSRPAITTTDRHASGNENDRNVAGVQSEDINTSAVNETDALNPSTQPTSSDDETGASPLAFQDPATARVRQSDDGDAYQYSNEGQNERRAAAGANVEPADGYSSGNRIAANTDNTSSNEQAATQGRSNASALRALDAKDNKTGIPANGLYSAETENAGAPLVAQRQSVNALTRNRGNAAEGQSSAAGASGVLKDGNTNVAGVSPLLKDNKANSVANDGGMTKGLYPSGFPSVADPILGSNDVGTQRSVAATPYSGIAANNVAGNTASGQGALSPREQAVLVDRNLPGLAPSRQPQLTFTREPEPDPVAAMFARLEQRERELREGGDDDKKKKDKDKDKDVLTSEKLWTSVGFAAGSFNNVNAGVTTTSSNAGISSNSGLASQQVNASGASYTVGLGLGTKLSERWVLQGGLNYQTQMYDYVSDKAVGDFQTLQAASINTLEKANSFDARSETRVVSTAPYTVNNDSRFVSLPVQAGYLVVNKRTGVQLNAGVSTDLFLQNTNGSSGSLGTTTERLGDNSTYRSVNFSGLFGTELSYKFSPRYRLTLSPGMRYTFNSIFKSSTGVQAMPLTFDVGLRFRYIFH